MGTDPIQAPLGRLREGEVLPFGYQEAVERGERTFFVSSSFLDSFQWNPLRKEATFRFPSGFQITFGEFPREWLDAFLAAPSKGEFYHSRIKAGYNKDRTWQYTLPVISQTRGHRSSGRRDQLHKA